MDREQFYREIIRHRAGYSARPRRNLRADRLAGWQAAVLAHGRTGAASAPASSRLPCHRVVNSQGRTVPAWPEQKILLENEDVAFRSNGHVDMRRSRWNPETE